MSVRDLIVRQLGPKGDGVHHGPEGRVYVARALPGDRVQARVHRDDLGVLRADIVEIVEPSPHRQEPPCALYERCGGCTLQHASEEFYRRWKASLAGEALRKHGLEPDRWLEPVFLGGGNRRRATFSAFRQRNKITMGYYRRRSRQIVDIRECLIAGPALLALRESIKPFLRFLLAEGKVLDVFVQIVGDTVDVVLTGPVGRSGEPDRGVQEALVGLLETTSVTRIGWRPTVRDEIEPLVWKGPVVAKFGPLQVELPPAAFLQPTLEGEQALVSGVMAALPPQGTFADLFSGCGTFSGPMLAGGAVEAFEVVRPAVSALQKAARGHALKVFRRDLFARPLQRRELDRYDAVVLDPPRAGCPEQASALASSKVPKIVSVSCNPATFARDARLICEGGYRLVSAQVFDQFLWSHHVELIGVFAKVKAWKRR